MKKKYIKYTLFGFNQLKARNLGLDLVDLALMRWFIDFKDFKDKDTGKRIMVSKLIDGEVMYWVHYDGVREALPIVKLKNADSVYRRFKKLVNAEILEHKTVKQGGVYSYYTTGKKYGELISEEYQEASDRNPTGTDKNPTGTDRNPMVADRNPSQADENPEQKINLIHSSNNNKFNIDKKEQSSTSSDSLLGIKKVIYLALKEVSPQDFAYGTWFEPCEVIETDNKVIIKAPNSIYGIMPRKYMKLIEETLDKPVELVEMER